MKRWPELDRLKRKGNGRIGEERARTSRVTAERREKLVVTVDALLSPSPVLRVAGKVVLAHLDVFFPGIFLRWERPMESRASCLPPTPRGASTSLVPDTHWTPAGGSGC